MRFRITTSLFFSHFSAIFRGSLLFFLICDLKCPAQNLFFHQLGTDLGLSNSAVYSIAQDQKGYMWFATPHGLNRYDSRKFETFFYAEEDSGSLSQDYVTAVLCDSKGLIWVGTSDGLNVYNPAGGTFKRIKKHPGEGSICDDLVASLYEDRKGRIWVGTSKGLSMLVSRERFTFKNYFHSGLPGTPGIREIWSVLEDNEGAYWIGSTTGLFRMTFRDRLPVYEAFNGPSAVLKGLKDSFITTMAEDSCNVLWVGTKGGGLHSWDRKTSGFVHYPASGEGGPCHDNIRQVLITRDGSLWVGTLDGLSVRNRSTGRFTHYQHHSDIRSISNNSVYAIFQDKSGSLWIGTYHGGVNLVYASENPFRKISLKGLNNNIISMVEEDNAGKLWVGTQGRGIAVLSHYGDREGVRPVRQYAKPAISSDHITSSYKAADGKIWVGTSTGGINCIDPRNGKVTQYRHVKGDANTLASDDIVAITGDTSGRIWAGTNSDGICAYDPTRNSFSQGSLGKPVNPKIRSLLAASDGNLLVGTSTGLEIISPDGRVTKAAGIPQIPTQIIFEDSRKRIWLSAYYSGLILYQPGSAGHRIYGRKDGLSSDYILGILEDKKGNLWLTTDNGITSFNPDTRVVRNYNASDGLPTNEFKRNAILKDQSGAFLMGSSQGLVYFHPDQVTVNRDAPRMVFTGLKLFNKSVKVNDQSGLLSQPFDETSGIIFRHFQNIFTVDFAALSYIRPEKNKFAYKLKGLESAWNYVSVPSATYTNLNSGTYTLLVKGTNNDGVWGEPLSLTIQVLKPWWKTWWAYSAYLFLAALVVFYISRFFWLQRVLQYEQALYQAKLDFFSNITHEIRTHILLVQGPIDLVLKQEHSNARISSLLSSAKKNGDRLFRLVSELLEFRKAEVNQVFLQVAEHDLVVFLKDILQSFSQLSETRKITLEFSAEKDQVRMPFDQVQLEKVIFNLLINAFKFTPDGGTIGLSVSSTDREVVIEVADNGKGIPSEHLLNVFASFFQVHEIGKRSSGYGIGLALSKKIVEQHQGTISVNSTPAMDDRPGFTVFTIRFPRIRT